MSDKYFRITQHFTEEEMASIVSALNYYAYNAPNMDNERYDFAMSALNKIMEAAEYGEI
jgi:hypothetical protein